MKEEERFMMLGFVSEKKRETALQLGVSKFMLLYILGFHLIILLLLLNIYCNIYSVTYISVGFGHSGLTFSKTGPDRVNPYGPGFFTREPVQPKKTARFSFFAFGYSGFGRFRFFCSALASGLIVYNIVYINVLLSGI
jgi:hypothetical protein